MAIIEYLVGLMKERFVSEEEMRQIAEEELGPWSPQLDPITKEVLRKIEAMRGYPGGPPGEIAREFGGGWKEDPRTRRKVEEAMRKELREKAEEREERMRF